MTVGIRRYWRWVVPLSAAVAVSAVVAVAGHSSTSVDRQSVMSNPAKSRLVNGERHVSSRLVANFHVLRGAHAADAGSPQPPLPLAAVRDFTATPASQYGVDPALARYVVSGPVGAWIVPGANGLCIYSDTGGTCGSVAGADAGTLREIVTAADGKETLVGIAPDGNSAVLVTDIAKVTHTVAVVDNLYAASDIKPASVLVRDSAGHEQTLETR